MNPKKEKERKKCIALIHSFIFLKNIYFNMKYVYLNVSK